MTSLPATLPVPQFAPLRGGPVLRWGIIAPGNIAHQFATGLRKHTDQRITAVASRSAERAASFAADFDVERVHASYEALVADPEVDIVYVASPHTSHREHALLAIAAGNNVLVEKPIGISAAEAREVAAAASAAGVFLLEAMWTRFQPKTVLIHQLVADGAIGDRGTHGHRGHRDTQVFAAEFAGLAHRGAVGEHLDAQVADRGQRYLVVQTTRRAGGEQVAGVGQGDAQ